MAEYEEIYLATREDWRDWLAENHATCPGIWLIYYKKHTGVERVPYDAAVEEAICFGWIDSTVRRLDDQRYAQIFLPRKKNSQWSALNRKRAEAMMADGLVEPAGLAAIEAARANGQWDRALEDTVDRPMPPELEAALEGQAKARRHFKSLTPTSQKYVKGHVAEAKRPETRVRRAEKLVGLLAKGWKPGEAV